MSKHSDWWSCDGGGESQAPRPAEHRHEGLTRRSLIAAAGIGALSWLGSRSALGQIAVNRGHSGGVLVVIFLRGGADGMSLVVPYGDDGYYRNRPTLAIPAPKPKGNLDLDGFFALHPGLAPLQPLFQKQELAIVHAVGSMDRSRSHFEAMSAMERGVERAGASLSSGWLARHLASTASATNSPMRAVAFTSVMPDSLRGASAIALESLQDFQLASPKSLGFDDYKSRLSSLYRGGTDAMSEAGRQTLEVLNTLQKLDTSRYAPEGRAIYPQTDLGTGLKQVAMLIKANVGLEVACLDKGGWDTHVIQGGTTGLLAGLISDTASSLAAFRQDLGSEFARVTVVAMTEFGRRLHENSSLGTDHGRASVMFLMGSRVRGGKVYGTWPGLADAQLEAPGDLQVTTDYRDVLSDVLAKHGETDLGATFPGYSPNSLGILA